MLTIIKIVGVIMFVHLVRYIMNNIEETYNIMQNPEVSCN